jgi:hypothetical protein
MASRFDYAPLASKVVTLLEKFGTKGCRILRAGAGSADEDKPWKPVGWTADQVIATNITIVSDNVSFRRGKWNARQALTESGQGKAYAAANVDGIEPGDWLDVPNGKGGWESFGITRAEQVAPGGTNVLWELTLRS